MFTINILNKSTLQSQQGVMTKEVFLKKLGSNIARLREKAGLSQTELALRCDKDRQSLNRIEKGRTNPSANRFPDNQWTSTVYVVCFQGEYQRCTVRNFGKPESKILLHRSVISNTIAFPEFWI